MYLIYISSSEVKYIIKRTIDMMRFQLGKSPYYINFYLFLGGLQIIVLWCLMWLRLCTTHQLQCVPQWHLNMWTKIVIVGAEFDHNLKWRGISHQTEHSVYVLININIDISYLSTYQNRYPEFSFDADSPGHIVGNEVWSALKSKVIDSDNRKWKGTTSWMKFLNWHYKIK